jgi:hypothetical protein
MDEINYSFKPTGQFQLAVLDLKPNYNISFHNNGQEIGKLDFNGPKMVFTGDAEESAKVFIDWVARSFHGRLEEERKAEREAIISRLLEIGALEDGVFIESIRARGNS